MGEFSVQFDAKQFLWLGNIVEDNNVLTVWHTAGVKSIDEAKKKELSIGATGASSPSVMYPHVSNALLGAKFKIIVGYPGGGDINLAMERGEVDGRGSTSWSSWLATRPDWVGEGKIIPLFQVGDRRSAALPDVPLWHELAGDDADRALLEALSASIAIGYSIIGPPGVPASRARALREAFDRTMREPAFLSDAKKQKMEVNPRSGSEVDEVVKRTVTLPGDLIERIKKVTDTKSAEFPTRR